MNRYNAFAPAWFVLALLVFASRAQAQKPPAAVPPAPMLSPADPADTAIEDLNPRSSTSNVAPTDVSSEDESNAAPPADPELLTIRLADGTAITGKLTIRELSLDTEFGKLVVPITKLKRLTPGLESRGALLAEVNRRIAQLGDDETPAREEARQALLKMGPQVAGELRRAKGDNAELAKRIDAILAGFAEEQAPDPLEPPVQPWGRGDTLVTTAFTAVGRVSPQTFTLKSPYGKLSIELSDIEAAFPARPANHREATTKSFNLAGSTVVKKEMLASGIRVERGDLLIVTAEGTITGSSSSRTSGPDGNQRLGNVMLDGEQVLGGTLIARIGGKRVRIGANRKLTCEQAGILYFGVAMDDNNARRGPFGGEYRLRIRVEPASEAAKQRPPSRPAAGQRRGTRHGGSYPPG